MFLASIVDKLNQLDDAKVGMLVGMGLISVINIFLGLRLLLTGEGSVFLQQEIGAIIALMTGINAIRAYLGRKKNGNGAPTTPGA